MISFEAASPEVARHRQIEYAPANAVDAEMLTVILEDIIDMHLIGRRATSCQDRSDEWFTTSVITYGEAEEPEPQQVCRRLSVWRSSESDTVLGGDTYIVSLAWSLPNRQLIDPSQTTSYIIGRPHDLQVDSAKLMVCRQTSPLVELAQERSRDIGANSSNYHEVDDKIVTEMVNWQRASRYDAISLFGELGIIYRALLTGA